MKKKPYTLIAALAAFFMLTLMSQTVLATEIEDEEPDGSTIAEIVEAAEKVIFSETTDPPETPVTNTPEPWGIQDDTPVTDYPETPPRPFTPPGTATVVDSATDEDGKVFYTITTTDENIFYLVIDKQRGTENVYFLNAVTIDNLMALASKPETQQNGAFALPQKTTEAEPEPPEPAPPEPEPQQGSGNSGMIFFIIATALIGGGSGWYFKIYKPKHRRGDMEEDTDYTNGEPGSYDDDGYDNEQDEGDTLHWYDDDEGESTDGDSSDGNDDDSDSDSGDNNGGDDGG